MKAHIRSHVSILGATDGTARPSPLMTPATAATSLRAVHKVKLWSLITWVILFTIFFYFTAKVRYNRLQGPLNSEQIWELEQAAREHAESKGFEEARAIVPRHVEISEPNSSKKQGARKSE